MSISYRLLQAGDRVPGGLSADDLTELYRHPVPGGRSWVRTNFVSTLDGAAQGADGRTGSINTASDRRVFALQRAHADVVLVGAGTVRTEHYRAVDLPGELRRLRARLGLEPMPTLAVVTRTGDVPALSTAADGRPGGPVLIMVVRRPGEPAADVAATTGAEVVHLQADEDDAAATIIDTLARRGLRRVLCEGGPRLNQALQQADLVDDICLTLSPLVVGGSAVRSASGVDLHRTFRLGHVISADDDALLLRYLRAGIDEEPAAETD